MYPTGVDMSAPEAANSDRSASGMLFRKSDIDGSPLMLGQIATYIATRSTRLTVQASSARRCS